MRATIAKCENCGGALRVPEGASQVQCSYCAVTSVLTASSGMQAGMPVLRIEAARSIRSYAAGFTVWFVLLSGLSVFCALGALTDRENAVERGLGAVFSALSALGLGFLALSQAKHKRELEWFRENGFPARATVRHISAPGDGYSARLGLELEVSGHAPRFLEHEADIPPLLVPRLTQGLTLPVIVHPLDPNRVEVQWHLV